ncbi:MAG: amidohydrolase family protein [Albidovulum sp.]|nr:amidohydrolase family protein [Albidovulum sp.]
MTYALTGCRITDARAGETIAGKSVVISGDKIEGIVEESSLPPGTSEIDLGGRYLCPGLIDCHSHCFIGQFNDRDTVLASELTARAGLHLGGMLSRGFTTVRDAGGADYGHKAALQKGLFTGPRMFVSGRILSQTGGHGDHRGRASLCSCGTSIGGISVIADGVDAVRYAARENIRQGVDQIKIMAGGGVASPGDELIHPQYSMDELFAIADEAERFGLYVMAHVYADIGIRRAVEAGVRSIEHGNFLQGDTAKLMREKNACLVPTLVTYEADAKYGMQFGWSEYNARKNSEVLDSGLRSLEVALENDVLIGYGTDLCWSPKSYQGDGLMIHEKVCGPAEALRHATINNAEIVRMKGKIGEIASGAYADILILDADPLRSMECFSQNSNALIGVIQGGTVRRDDLGLAEKLKN